MDEKIEKEQNENSDETLIEEDEREKVIDKDVKQINPEQTSSQSNLFLVVFLCGAVHFGNAFTANSAGPLQQEIQDYLKIDDKQFNMMYSSCSMVSMVVPFFLPLLIEKIGVRVICISFAIFSMLGQGIFIKGLQTQDYHLCLISRVIFGISDSMTVVQQTILCMWFSDDQLPAAFGMLLFSVKFFRAINDNTAASVYNQNHNIMDHFYNGLYVCFFSLACSFILYVIHGRFEKEQLIKAQTQKAKQQKQKVGSSSNDQLTIEAWLVVIFYILIYATIHSFYPNMSKFLQKNYGMTNDYAGHLASIPYLFASFTVPISGHLLSVIGPGWYEIALTCSPLCILLAHLSFSLLNEFGPGIYAIFVPIVLIGIGHSLQAALLAPIVGKLVDQKLQTKVFSMVKISEGLGISTFLYINGSIVESTGSYAGVTFGLVILSILAILNGLYLYSLAQNLIKSEPKQKEEKQSEKEMKDLAIKTSSLQQRKKQDKKALKDTKH